MSPAARRNKARVAGPKNWVLGSKLMDFLKEIRENAGGCKVGQLGRLRPGPGTDPPRSGNWEVCGPAPPTISRLLGGCRWRSPGTARSIGKIGRRRTTLQARLAIRPGGDGAGAAAMGVAAKVGELGGSGAAARGRGCKVGELGGFRPGAPDHLAAARRLPLGLTGNRAFHWKDRAPKDHSTSAPRDSHRRNVPRATRQPRGEPTWQGPKERIGTIGALAPRPPASKGPRKES